MKRLHLTGIKRVLNDAAQKRLDEYNQNNDVEEATDENGKTLEYYQNIGIPAPKELLQRQDEIDNGIHFDLDEDYDIYEVDITVNIDSFVMCIDDVEEGARVFLKDGSWVDVQEDSSDINAQIWYLNRGTIEKLKEWWLIQKLKYFKRKNGTNSNK